MNKTCQKRRKGQSAMEFLMTYGWALLALMMALGALAYFGVINPSKSLPEKCPFSNGIVCRDALLSTTTLNLTMINGIGQTIYNVNATPETGSFTGTCTASSATVVSDGEFRINCVITSITPPLTVGKNTRLKMKVNFRKTVTGYNHVSSGEVYTSVQ